MLVGERKQDTATSASERRGGWLLSLDASSSSVAAAIGTTAPSGMQQSVDVGGELLQLDQGGALGSGDEASAFR